MTGISVGKEPVPKAGSGRPPGPNTGISKGIVALKLGQVLYVDDMSKRSSASSLASRHGRMLRRKFVTRKVTDTRFGIWRVA